jgi:hypothetical protein
LRDDDERRVGNDPSLFLANGDIACEMFRSRWLSCPHCFYRSAYSGSTFGISLAAFHNAIFRVQRRVPRIITSRGGFVCASHEILDFFPVSDAQHISGFLRA